MRATASSVELAAWLRERGAQHDVVVYAARFGDDLARFWAECPRGDWLLAIAVRAGVDGAVVALAAVELAELARDFLPDDDTLAHEVLAAARHAAEPGAQGGAEALAAMVEALERSADRAPDPAVQAARTAIVCAARAASRPEEAAVVPALLAQAAACDAGDCAMEAAVAYTQRRCADLVRLRIGPPTGLAS